jgi:tRNA dimethylallyltransferase
MAPVVAVVGPTATGKSALGIALAHQLGGEVINADSMQLYKGMDIGTAKLTIEERDGVPHHLLDLWDVTKTASVADYQVLCRTLIDELLARDVTPILVGGSGLYIRAALDQIEFPGADAMVRARLEAEAETGGAPALHAKLAVVDPAAAAAIAPENARKIVRALEVIEVTGKPFTTTLPSYDNAVYETTYVGVDLDTEMLDERIEQRVELMFAHGLEDEVRRLEAQGLRDGFTAPRALGYAQLLAHFDGKLTLEQARSQTVQTTRRFVRRQRSWFRRDPRITWLDAKGPVTDAAVTLITA